jgi:hypothetical protein
MTRGRKPEGRQQVQGLDGSEEAKARLALYLETLAGKKTIAEAALALGLSERRFHVLRSRLLQAALDRLEPRPVGRPARHSGEASGQVTALQAQVRDLRLELRAAQIREEIALAMPHLLRRTGRGTRAARRPRRRGGASGGCGPSGRCAGPGRTVTAAPQRNGVCGRWSATSAPTPSPCCGGRPARGCA